MTRIRGFKGLAWSPEDVKSLRRRLGLSVREMATVLGVKQKTFQRLENGHIAPSGALKTKLWQLQGASSAVELEAPPVLPTRTPRQQARASLAIVLAEMREDDPLDRWKVRLRPILSELHTLLAAERMADTALLTAVLRLEDTWPRDDGPLSPENIRARIEIVRDLLQ